MPIDATQRPLKVKRDFDSFLLFEFYPIRFATKEWVGGIPRKKIPPQYQVYAEQYNVFDLFQRMTESLVVDLPTDPLRYMADWLKIDSTRKIHAAIIGPPGSGKRMLG